MSLTGWIQAEMEAREKARRDRFAQDMINKAKDLV